MRKVIISQIYDYCNNNLVYDCFRGSEDDVLSRYFECAKKYNADVIVRLTADCPLIDPIIVDKVIKLYFKSKVDYSANNVPPETRMFPDGSDVEVFSFKALEKAFYNAKKGSEREHVTHYFWRSDSSFKIAQLSQKNDWSQYRYTVDYPEDFEVVKFVLEELKSRNSFGSLAEIVQIIDSNPQIKEKNSKYYFGIGWIDKK